LDHSSDDVVEVEKVAPKIRVPQTKLKTGRFSQSGQIVQVSILRISGVKVVSASFCQFSKFLAKLAISNYVTIINAMIIFLPKN
jgi:hypothetical protein